ncbi:MAG TPA: acyl carrier protein [Dokdonella sp.]|nr:acyl carrier protein [Dokdonella sp.]
MSPDLQNQIFAIIADQAKLDVATIRADSTLKDLGVASLDAIEVIFEIEEKFDVTLSDSDADLKSDTVQGLIDAVRRAQDAKGSPVPAH